MNKIIFAVVALSLSMWLGFLKGRADHATRKVRSEEHREVVDQALRNEGPRPSQFKWNDIEDDDLSKFILNLRSIGCPETVISDLVHARVFAEYQARVNRIFNPLARYWSTSVEMKEVDLQVAAVRKERDEVLAALGVYGSDADVLNGLPPEKMRYISEAARLYPKNFPGPDGTAQEWREALENRKRRVGYLSQFLTPDELLNYRITQDGNPVGIGTLLQDINPSNDEFRKVFSALDGEKLNQTNGFMAPELETRLRQALGEDRYGEYRDQLAPDNFYFNTFCRTRNLPYETVTQLKDLRAVATTINPDEYRAIVTKILPNKYDVEIYFSTPSIYRGKSQ